MVSIEVEGIPCVFNEEALDDYEMLERLARLQQGDVIALVGFANGVFGEEQMSNIKTQLKDESGVCRLSAMSDFVIAALQAASKAKKADSKN